ncbi:type 4a pilus biogenesis protein PilO [Planosporangium thailandense]|uniref:Type 4a pilus biogenesis protein PilO n=1 Tax=Planosporangium thailandense TaxID=765197 RepID=A0ABX0Y9W5_9ACTN|nr:type 4a pilus biogenesis protein PilO [Planosporangium thailandense]NJC74195.1 type 4a pilus biogenesis protein PilO [Planosporangium thailandense]
MAARHGDRLWIAGGVLAAAALFAAAWLFLIRPQYSEAGALREQTATASLRLSTLQKRLTQLRQQNGDLATYQAQLERDRRSLPTSADLSAFLADLQGAGAAAGVSVGGVSVGSPTQVTARGTRIQALPVTLSASGSAAGLNQFLDQLQQVQPRAVLITSAGLSADAEPATSYTLSLKTQVFVAPAASTAAKTPTN